MLGGMKDEKTSLVDMIGGAALFFSRVTRNLEVRTATVNAGVEGTEFFLRVEEGKTDLTVFEGKVLASNAAGGLPVTTGQSAVAEAGKAPVYRVVVRPRDAVQWALYYPPVLDSRPADRKEDSSDPRFYTARASQLLAVGRVDEATADIDKAQKLDPKSSDAFALQAMIAVTQNEREKALDLARKATESDPKSATARIALSYAQQAQFDLPGALGSLEEAVKLAPENALAWARLAELQQSFGDLDKSLDSAKKAAALRPDLSRTQTVLGFSHLTRVETVEAKGAFEKAIKLDDADPLPRLGLGLAKIREGHLEEGRREIEIAMSLDPNNSLIRSYLGKAYYEEKRDKLATGQYEMAKSLGPSDPTPYFYDAIEKQTTNRPVEALHDLEKSIELNDNRAVYRSRLLLDSDLAARSASLARIYSDLGFQQRALVEGWKSVNADPSDFSGHRFLADTYAALPRHEVARVSELLQSQLLQPTNITPVQPRLSESNLLLISAGGPGSVSFNEFNPLFNRDGVTLQASGLVGENSTWSGEGVLAGIYKKASYSLGYTHFETDGWRANADQKDDIADVFFQMELSPKTSIQGEYRYRKIEKGDIRLRFFPEDFYPGERNKEEYNNYRVGLRHAFSPASTIVFSLIYQKADFSLNDQQPTEPVLTSIDTKMPQDAGIGEIAYLYRSSRFRLTSGAGYAKVSGDLTSTVGTVFPPPDDLISASSSTDLKHTNIYLYSNIDLLKNLTLTVGASGDFIKGENLGFEDINQFNPKIGVTWSPFSNTTLRGAAFRVLKRTLVTNQTLEPTQVAGFNQFYDDANGTDAWNYGVALDQKFSNDLFGGVEFSRRDLNVPFLDYSADPSNPVSTTVDWEEKLGRAYLYWSPHSWVALKAEYFYERVKRDARQPDGPIEMNTYRVPLGVNFFHPSGLGALLKATYIKQDGEFEGFSGGESRTGDDKFWLVDAAINYRLPKRYGVMTVGVNNLFDEKFNYFELDRNNPSVQPGRIFYAKVTLSLGP
jgi:tetratricopeptide (TPR) repeat protein